jgi:two-component system chemotaxis response regulator CheB
MNRVPANKIVALGASAGGVEALRTVVSRLHRDSAAAYFVVLHTAPTGPSQLARVLNDSGPLPAVSARDGMPIESGTIYVAEPDYHLNVSRGHVHLIRGPKENRVRPSVNSLFRSAAAAYGPTAIGVLLSGCLDDGTIGLWEIKRHGGTTIVQQPEDALYDAMPRNAIANVDVDYILPAMEIPSVVESLVANAPEAALSGERTGMTSEPTMLTCPECRGPMKQTMWGPFPEYQCRVGHTYSPESALGAHEDTEERALWAAVVALEEGAEFAERVAERHPTSDEELRRRAERKRLSANLIRDIVASGGGPVNFS